MARDEKDRDPIRGGRIKERRLAVRGRSQPVLAQLLGVSARTVQEWERGFTVPAVKLPILAHALGTTPEYLLGETDDPYGDADLEKRLARLEALAGALASDRVSGEQSAKAGFEIASQRIAEARDEITALRSEMEKLRLSVAAQGEAQGTMLLQLQGLRRDVQSLATSDTSATSKQGRGKSQRPPRQANH
jgi:transcriptional regulator with XRE-family HTH domain